jgi:predicted CXXCH cytochrome family protein
MRGIPVCRLGGLALILVAVAVAGAAPAAPPRPAPAATAPAAQAEEVEGCLACHGDKDMSTTLPSGEALSLFVDAQAFRHSVHGDKLGCLACHAGMSAMPHPTQPFRTRRERTVAMYEQCKSCHFANYTKTVDSVHYARLAAGDPKAPVCSDCHTAHAITRPDVPRSRISTTCASCHGKTFDAYAKSVHGQALLSEENRDVPVCTDCHRSHNIGDPKTPGFRLGTLELCSGCHTNEKVMRKYGLSTNVLSTYLADFHGMTVSARRAAGAGDPGPTALCVDCHGVHDVAPTRASGSPVMQANLVAVCQRCHAGATENFPAAWLSHYEPSWEKAPIVYGVTIFYRIFIPFVIGGLVLQILLHLWRVVVNR